MSSSGWPSGRRKGSLAHGWVLPNSRDALTTNRLTASRGAGGGAGGGAAWGWGLPRGSIYNNNRVDAISAPQQGNSRSNSVAQNET